MRFPYRHHMICESNILHISAVTLNIILLDTMELNDQGKSFYIYMKRTELNNLEQWKRLQASSFWHRDSNPGLPFYMWSPYPTDCMSKVRNQ